MNVGKHMLFVFVVENEIQIFFACIWMFDVSAGRRSAQLL